MKQRNIGFYYSGWESIHSFVSFVVFFDRDGEILIGTSMIYHYLEERAVSSREIGIPCFSGVLSN